ncbi:MAG: hypothetical protein ACR2HP_17615 [Ilumatobacteraceae bacterium]
MTDQAPIDRPDDETETGGARLDDPEGAAERAGIVDQQDAVLSAMEDGPETE